MKILTTREDIAKSIRTMPVLRLDVTSVSDSKLGTRGACFRFDECRLNPYTQQPLTTRHEIRLFNDNILPSVIEPCAGIVNEMTYSDWDQVLNFTNVPVLHDNEQFVLVLENPTFRRMMFVVLTMCKAPLSGNIYIEDFTMANRETATPMMAEVLKNVVRPNRRTI